MTPIAPDVWHVPVQPMKFLGGVRMPLASTVLRLGDGKVLIYAPGKFDDEQLGAINALGEVAYIIAPNLYHHLYVAKAAERWPNAKIYGAPGLAAKRKDLTFHEELSAGTLADHVDVEIMGGAPKMNEAVLFHRPTGTLLCADLLFNVTKPANAFTKFALSLTGVNGGLKMSKLWKWTAKDKPALRSSIDRVMAWPIQHVAPTHGEPADVNREHLAPLFQGAYGSVPAIR